MGKLSKKQKKELIRIIVALVLFILIAFLERTANSFLDYDQTPALVSLFANSWSCLAVWLVPYLIVGWDVVRKCFLGIIHGQLFDESFLMTLATIGAFGCGENMEAVAVMLFYQVGEFFQSYAVGKSRGAIQELMSIAPDYANRINLDGSIEEIDPDDIEVGDLLLVKPGEKLPIDGFVVEGEGLVNTSALTGESMPQSVAVGDKVISGCINGDSLLKIQADRLYDDSTVAQILELVENAASKKSHTENFITRFARYYTPIVVICAVILAFVPPIIAGPFSAEFGKWVLRACTFLVISCPCALVISVPLAFFGGIGAASRAGVLVKGSNYLEMLADIDTVVCDKTGTLTEGRFSVAMIEAEDGYSTDDILRIAAAVESSSTHPIALSIVHAYEDLLRANGQSNRKLKPLSDLKLQELENISGKGIVARVNKSKLAVGNRALFELLDIEIPEGLEVKGTVVYVAENGRYIGAISLADKPKPEAKQSIKELLAEGVRRIVMLTGDSELAAKLVADELGISEYKAQLLPQNKVSVVEKLIDELSGRSGGRDKVEGSSDGAAGTSEVESSGAIGGRSHGKRFVAFIGDGVNDAPVLTRADVGIAMGTLGSDAAIEAADVVVMDDSLTRLPTVIRIARRTIGISRANIVFALAVKLVCLLLGAVGIANMWVAVFADVGVAVICILNSMRMLRN